MVTIKKLWSLEWPQKVETRREVAFWVTLTKTRRLRSWWSLTHPTSTMYEKVLQVQPAWCFTRKNLLQKRQMLQEWLPDKLVTVTKIAVNNCKGRNTNVNESICTWTQNITSWSTTRAKSILKMLWKRLRCDSIFTAKFKTPTCLFEPNHKLLLPITKKNKQNPHDHCIMRKKTALMMIKYDTWKKRKKRLRLGKVISI